MNPLIDVRSHFCATLTTVTTFAICPPVLSSLLYKMHFLEFFLPKNLQNPISLPYLCTRNRESPEFSKAKPQKYAHLSPYGLRRSSEPPPKELREKTAALSCQHGRLQ